MLKSPLKFNFKDYKKFPFQWRRNEPAQGPIWLDDAYQLVDDRIKNLFKRGTGFNKFESNLAPELGDWELPYATWVYSYTHDGMEKVSLRLTVRQKDTNSDNTFWSLRMATEFIAPTLTHVISVTVESVSKLPANEELAMWSAILLK